MKNNPHKDLTDKELFERFQQGDEYAFTVIYQRYQGCLYLHALKMLNDRDKAQDVIQELFTRFWHKRNDLVLTTSLSSYLYTAVRNKVLDEFAHEKVIAKYQQSLQEFMDKGEYVTDSWVRERELTAIIEKEIAALPPKMREVFELSRKGYLSYQAIAEKLDVSEHTVRKHITRAIKKLRSKFDLVTILISILLKLH